MVDEYFIYHCWYLQQCEIFDLEIPLPISTKITRNMGPYNQLL